MLSEKAETSHSEICSVEPSRIPAFSMSSTIPMYLEYKHVFGRHLTVSAGVKTLQAVSLGYVQVWQSVRAKDRYP